MTHKEPKIFSDGPFFSVKRSWIIVFILIAGVAFASFFV